MATPAEHHAERIRRNMELTLENIVRTNNCIAFSIDNKLKARLRAKNECRMAALDRMQSSLNAGAPPS